MSYTTVCFLHFLAPPRDAEKDVPKRFLTNGVTRRAWTSDADLVRYAFVKS